MQYTLKESFETPNAVSGVTAVFGCVLRVVVESDTVLATRLTGLFSIIPHGLVPPPKAFQEVWPRWLSVCRPFLSPAVFLTFPSRSAWSGPRASPTYAPSSLSPRPQVSAQNTQQSPPYAQTNGARPSEPTHDRVLRSLVGLTVCRLPPPPPCRISYLSFVGDHRYSGY